ncbi:hypothetical protein MPSEU_000301000 [Mayamaea pseudoterrestris]|nr:hypothetical protein MPSEU_000301000 [Mayamaea pseudoterrestris]
MSHKDDDRRTNRNETPQRGSAIATPSHRIMTTPRIFQQHPTTGPPRRQLAFEDEQQRRQQQQQQGNDHHGSTMSSRSVAESSTTSGLIRPSTVQTPTKFRTPIQPQSAPAKSRTTTEGRRTSARSLHHSPLVAKQSTSSGSMSGSSNFAKFRKIRFSQQSSKTRTFSSSSNNNTTTTKHRDFITEASLPRLQVRTVSLTQRCAFERRPLMPLDEWTQIASQQSEQRQTNVSLRMSPSYQHLQVLHALCVEKQTIRQLHFGPSMGQDADLFVDWLSGDDDRDAAAPKKVNIHDGRYRSIDPVQATLALLPASKVAPVFSHKKTRLPMRIDVGFPNATEMEVRQKQLEIQHETEWEEASPRLALLVTSDDFGTVMSDNENGSDDQVKCQEHLEYNGGGLPDMPFAGRALLQAKERNAKHFRRKSLSHLRKYMEPDPYSMLAPPLDATYSQSQGWRPRPYHDRPAGMKYLLACPLEVSFFVGDIEPLVCSLALYSLPRSGKIEQGEAYGKMSEEFWFPAGDWDSDKVQFEGAKREDGTIDEDILEAWMRRKRKAIFSYDSFTLTESCVLVLQVFNVIRPDALTPYLQHDAVDSSSTGKISDTASDVRISADRAFEQHGAQLLSPLCFGFTQLSMSDDAANNEDESSLVWPRGETHNFQLYPSPDRCHSQELFVEVLASLVSSGADLSPIPESPLTCEAQGDYMQTLTENSECVVSLNGPSFTSRRSRVSVARMFKMTTRKKNTAKGVDDKDDCRDRQSHDLSQAIGFGKIYHSKLPTDFLQCMLSNPIELESSQNEKNGTPSLPRLFVDVSGDCSVILDPDTPEEGDRVKARGRKRSNLLRLPLPREQSGYIPSAEYQELLYLPPKLEKHYEADIGFPCRSLINVLYLYPRLLRGDNANSGSRFTLRFQVRHAQSNNDDESEGNPGAPTVRVFYNPAPWTGPSLVDELYTRIGSGDNDLETGILFRDEIKVRLPEVLDGSYTLNVTIFEVELNATVANIHELASITIPLSTSSARGSDVKDRIATVIPNGNHRLKLGKYQLQLESRLISSLHTGDPAMALILRDYPMQVTQSHQPQLAHTERNDDSSSGKAEPTLFKASGATIAAHFEALLFMVTSDLVMRENGDRAPKRTSSHLINMFEVLNKIRQRFLDFKRIGRAQMASFLKGQLDCFEESIALPPTSINNSLAADVLPMKKDDITDVPSDQTYVESENIDPAEEKERKRAARARRRSRRLSTRHEIRMSRLVDNLGAAGRAFSRVSYGAANRVDHMLVESETHRDQEKFAFYFEDDETVFTAPTIAGPRALDKNEMEFIVNTVRSPKRRHSENSIVRSGVAPPEEQSHLNGGQEFAQRVRTVAQVMLAPCGVAPTAFMHPAAAPGPNLKSNPLISKAYDAAHATKITELTVHSGSDVDDEPSIKSTGQSDNSASQTSRLGDANGSPLLFSMENFDSCVVESAVGKYLYETVLVQWLRAWMDDSELKQTRAVRTHNRTASPSEQSSFYDHQNFLLPLCLKSISLRCEIENMHGSATPALLDDVHMHVLSLVVDMLAREVMDGASPMLESKETRDQAFLCALSNSKVINDFLIGLSGILHPEHTNVLITNYVAALRSFETDSFNSATDPPWTDGAVVHRIKCSRQLRLQVVETFAVLPYFMSLNFPSKFASVQDNEKPIRATWMHQVYDWKPYYSTSPVDEKLPHAGWLANLLVSEALSICAVSCDTVLTEAVTMTEETPRTCKDSLLAREPHGVLGCDDLLVFQSIAIHAITCVYELIIRRHSMDRRYQSELCQERVAGVIGTPILQTSIAAARWLARLKSGHRVRVLWMMSLIYILQESPEPFVGLFIRGLCNNSSGFGIHRFVRLLRLGSATFQCLINCSPHKNLTKELGHDIAQWIVQESFNTICATAIVVVDECANRLAAFPKEQERVAAGILDLLLHILTMPQSPVTHLRAVGGALQVLELFGVEVFLEVTGQELQHWLRVILSLMNSTSLSVRSIAVDFFVSLLGSTYDFLGCTDELTITFATLLPESAAREIALFSVAGLVSCSEDLVRCLWPLRRSIADLEDTDERIDTQLVPTLSAFCRACQAIIDGVLLEVRLRGECTVIAGTEVSFSVSDALDADEESLLEAASYFFPESGPMQRLRWLLSLRTLHEQKCQWIEAGETLLLCAATITSSLPHLKDVWRPSRYDHRVDSGKAGWLDSIGDGEDLAHPNRGDVQVLCFAQEFLEPGNLFNSAETDTVTNKLQQPTIQSMSKLLIQISRDVVHSFARHEGMEDYVSARLETLLSSVMGILQSLRPKATDERSMRGMVLKQWMDDERALRNAIISITAEMAKVSNDCIQTAPGEEGTGEQIILNRPRSNRPSFLVARISGKKSLRFLESTGIPVFLEPAVPFICRMPPDTNTFVSVVGTDLQTPALLFAQQLVSSLYKECPHESVILSLEPWNDDGDVTDESKTYLHVFSVEAIDSELIIGGGSRSKVFFYRKPGRDVGQPAVIELKVAQYFPYALSRQRVLVTTEIVAAQVRY